MLGLTDLGMKYKRGSALLDWVERVGNRLPDPAVHFLIALAVVVTLSAALSTTDFGVTDPRTGQPLRIVNQLTPESLTRTLESAVSTYVSFPPLGLILVAALGVGVAEHSGLVGAVLKTMLELAPTSLLTPMILAVTIVAGVASDAALLVMAPLGGAVFYAAGRHPLAGVLAAYTANMMLIAGFAPSPIDVVLQGFTQKAAQVLAPGREVNPLCNMAYMAAAGVLTILVGWIVIERFVEPRLKGMPVDGDPAGLPKNEPLSGRESRALGWALALAAAMLALFCLAAWPAASPLRAKDGTLTGMGSPLMKSLVPLIFLLAAVPGFFYGRLSGAFASHKDAVRAMSRTMSSMGYYMVMVFFASQFVRGFGESNLGTLIAVKGGLALKALALPPLLTLTGLIVLAALNDLIVASASAKWAMLAPIFVPMLMTAGIAPEAIQLAYRIGDAPMNVLTPLSPYFPLAVAFCARYVRGTGIGTIISLCLPMAGALAAAYLLAFAAFWTLGLPLGIQSHFVYP